MLQRHASYRWTTSQCSRRCAAAARTSDYSPIRNCAGKRTRAPGITYTRRLTARRAPIDGAHPRSNLRQLLVSHRGHVLVRHHPVVGAWGHRLARRVRQLLRLLLLAAMAGHSTLAARLARFFAGPLVRSALLMRSFPALAGDVALLVPVLRSKAAIFFCHHTLLPGRIIRAARPACSQILGLQRSYHLSGCNSQPSRHLANGFPMDP